MGYKAGARNTHGMITGMRVAGIGDAIAILGLFRDFRQ